MNRLYKTYILLRRKAVKILKDILSFFIVIKLRNNMKVSSNESKSFKYDFELEDLKTKSTLYSSEPQDLNLNIEVETNALTILSELRASSPNNIEFNFEIGKNFLDFTAELSVREETSTLLTYFDYIPNVGKFKIKPIPYLADKYSFRESIENFSANFDMDIDSVSSPADLMYVKETNLRTSTEFINLIPSEWKNLQVAETKIKVYLTPILNSYYRNEFLWNIKHYVPVKPLVESFVSDLFTVPFDVQKIRDYFQGEAYNSSLLKYINFLKSVKIPFGPINALPFESKFFNFIWLDFVKTPFISTLQSAIKNAIGHTNIDISHSESFKLNLLPAELDYLNSLTFFENDLLSKININNYLITGLNTNWIESPDLNYNYIIIDSNPISFSPWLEFSQEDGKFNYDLNIQTLNPTNLSLFTTLGEGVDFTTPFTSLEKTDLTSFTSVDMALPFEANITLEHYDFTYLENVDILIPNITINPTFTLHDAFWAGAELGVSDLFFDNEFISRKADTFSLEFNDAVLDVLNQVNSSTSALVNPSPDLGKYIVKMSSTLKPLTASYKSLEYVNILTEAPISLENSFILREGDIFSAQLNENKFIKNQLLLLNNNENIDLNTFNLDEKIDLLNNLLSATSVSSSSKLSTNNSVTSCFIYLRFAKLIEYNHDYDTLNSMEPKTLHDLTYYRFNY